MGERPRWALAIAISGKVLMMAQAGRFSAQDDSHLRRRELSLALALSLALLGGCASPPPRHVIARTTLPPTPPPTVSTRVYFYPMAGQSAEQQDRDRFECYNWAVKQTGFDPSQSRSVPRERVEIVPVPPPGTHTAVGAATGAVIGAAVAPRHDTIEGAVVGAVAGAVIGAASDTARQEQAAQVQERYDRRQDAQSVAHAERQARDFRRAMGACLEGRNYSVR